MAVLFVCLLIRSFRWVYCGYSCYFCFFCWVDLMMVLLMWNPMWNHYMMYPYTWQSGYALFRFPMMTTSYHIVACSTVFHYLPHANIMPSFSILSCLPLSWPTFSSIKMTLTAQKMGSPPGYAFIGIYLPFCLHNWQRIETRSYKIGRFVWTVDKDINFRYSKHQISRFPPFCLHENKDRKWCTNLRISVGIPFTRPRKKMGSPPGYALTAINALFLSTNWQCVSISESHSQDRAIFGRTMLTRIE